jgi:F-type H+-transporting ATPase subunit a
MKSSTASWSTTLALALCVFFYVQYTAIRELGFLGYLDHLAGKQRGILAFTVVLPLFMLILHILTELIRPLSLSLRLRGNMWGDEVLLGLLSGFGIKGLPLLFFNMLMATLTAVVQAAVFCLLTTIYFALVLNHQEETV